MKTIFYHGADDEFFQSLSRFSENFLPDSRAMHIPPGNADLIRQIFHLKPGIVFLTLPVEPELINAMVKLKQIEETRSIFWVLVVKNEEEVRANELLLSAGVVLFHLQELESDPLFSETFFLVFQLKQRKNRFARAKGLDIPLTASNPSVLRSVSESSAFIETDLELEGSIIVPYNFLNHDSAIASPIRKKHVLLCSPFMYGYEVELPFPGPWDELTPESLQPDLVTTWLNLYQEKFSTRQKFLTIFSQNQKFYEDMCTRDRNSSFWLNFHSKAASSTNLFHEAKPGLVLFDLVTDKGLDVYQLEVIIDNLRVTDGQETLVVVFNSRTESEALKKLFNYKLIMAVPTSLNYEFFSSFQTKIADKIKNENSVSKFFQHTDHSRLLSVPFPVHLSGLTENDITFYSPLELHCYTVLKFELPIPLFITIVPDEELHKGIRGNHYRGLIHGLSEENKARLRKIVNQLIFYPVKELSEESVANMLKQDYNQKNDVPSEEPTRTGNDSIFPASTVERERQVTQGISILRPKGKKSKL